MLVWATHKWWNELNDRWEIKQEDREVYERQKYSHELAEELLAIYVRSCKQSDSVESLGTIDI